MDKDRKDKDMLSGAENAPEDTSTRAPIEGRYRSARAEDAANPSDEALLEKEPDYDIPLETAAAEEEDEDVFIPTPLDKKPVKKKKKHKKALPLLITVCVFVVLFAGYAAMVWLIPDRVVEDDTVIKEYTDLISYNTNQISALDFTYRDGYHYRVELSRYVNESGYTTTVFSVDGKEEFEYDQSTMSLMLQQVVGISSGTVANVEADLSIYGLDNPKVTLVYYLLDENGETVEGQTLRVGDAAPVGNGHYAMLDGDNTIYVIGYADADYLVMTDYDYRVLELLTIEDYVNGIQSFEICRGDDHLHVARATTEEKHSLEYATTYRIYEPALVNANTYYVESKVLTYVQSIFAQSAVEDYPEDLAAYGLSEADEPLEIAIEDIDGKVTKFTLANKLNEDGTIYGKVNGQTTIYTFDPAYFDFANTTYADLLDMTIWSHDFVDLDRFEILIEGKTYTVTIEDNGDDTYKTFLDGKEILDSDARMLYARLLQVYLDDILTEDDVVSDKITYAFYLYDKDGTVRSLELAEISPRRFAVILDGEPQEYFVRYNDLLNVFSGIEDLLEGLHLGYAV